MRKRMRDQIFRRKLIANCSIGNVLSSLAALLEPSISAYAQRRHSILHLRSRPPVLKSVRIQSEEKSFTKLFNSWQPRWVAGKWRASHGETHVLELFGNDGSRFEP